MSFDDKRLSKQLRGEQSRIIYNRDIKPIVGNIKLIDLSFYHLNKVFDVKAGSDGKRMAGAIGVCHKFINQVINHALTLNMLNSHPVSQLKVKDVGGGSCVTKRNLSFSELKSLLANLDDWNTDCADLLLI